MSAEPLPPKKRKRKCSCEALLDEQGRCTATPSCDEHRKPHVREAALQRQLERREQAAGRPILLSTRSVRAAAARVNPALNATYYQRNRRRRPNT